MKRSDDCPKICIVGTNQLHYELLSFCLENELKADCVLYDNLPAGDNADAENGRREVWLFDCHGLGMADLEQCFETFESAQLADILVALFNVSPELRLEGFIRQNRIRGIFYRDESRQVFLDGIHAILDGHLWFTRKMMSKCILINKETSNPFIQSKGNLSGREKVILQWVASGASNQDIADQLEISVHTVKTHLYKIYRKLEVPNRLQATRWAKACLLNPSQIQKSATSSNTDSRKLH